MDSNPYFSIVIPVYNGEDSLKPLCDRLKNTLEKINKNYEIILVNDESPDNSLEIIRQLNIEDKRIIGLELSRNFGQHMAIRAGLDHAKGEWIVVMDCDLQDLPEEIVKFYEKSKEGYDLVVGKRNSRKDSLYRKIISKIYFFLFKKLSDLKISDGGNLNFGIYHRTVIKNILKLSEYGTSFGIMAIWVGFKRAEIYVEHAAREFGESSYTFSVMLNQAVSYIFFYSNKFLYLTVKLGLLLSLSSFVLIAVILYRYFILGYSYQGWTSQFVLTTFFSGLIILSIGILGIYIGGIFDQVKRRPFYLLRSKIG